MDNITTSRSIISVEELREEGNLIIYCRFATAGSMEGNNDMPSVSTSETQPLEEIDEESEISDPMAIFGYDACNGIAHKANSIPPKAYV